MGTFTLPLKTVIEIEGGEIGLSDYPIFEESYRDALNQKIVDHYWNQEIGQETISMFTFALKRKMNEIMPLYNQHYVLSLLEIDPLSTLSIRAIAGSEGTTTTNGVSTNTATSDAKARAVASDFPQMQLKPDSDYATSAQDNTSNTTSGGNATDDQESTQVASQDSTTDGYQGHAPTLILQARQALVNIDMLVIEDLRELFMLIWANNDSFSGRRNTYYGLY